MSILCANMNANKNICMHYVAVFSVGYTHTALQFVKQILPLPPGMIILCVYNNVVK